MEPDNIPVQTKQCRACSTVKPLTDFSMEKGRLRLSCKACKCLDAKRRREQNLELSRLRERADYKKNRKRKAEEQRRHRRKKTSAKRQAIDRAQNLKRKGITVEQYDAMHAAQGGKCMICKEPETNPVIGDDSRVRRLAVDHDHTTNAIRDLLCNRCNRAIGLFKDDPAVMLEAIAYLQMHKTRTVPSNKIIPFSKAA